MVTLSPHTVLRRAANIELSLRASGAVVLTLDGARMECGARVLATLDLFTYPRSLADALRVLEDRGVSDVAEASKFIADLHEANVLRDVSEPAVRVRPHGFDSASIHVSMLDDRARTGGFLHALKEVVREGDVVLDIGTGTGVLAVGAARAGARHVYAIEEGQIASTARALVAANGLSDRITVIDGRSTHVDIPEPADVIVSETIGDDPLDEQILEIFDDAWGRLLRPGARCIPRSLAIWALPVAIPPGFMAERAFLPENLERWRADYGVDFSALAAHDTRSIYRILVMPQTTAVWEPLSEEIQIAEVEFADGAPVSITRDIEFTPRGTARHVGVLIYFDAQLGPTTRITTRPSEVDGGSAWHCSLWYLAGNTSSPTGSGTVRLRYTSGGSRTEVVAI